jgi:hypothetical protein
MKIGKFSKAYKLTEETAYSKDAYRLTKVIKISKTGNKFYQTEQTWRNSVMTYMAQYPAETEYAKERRENICQF